MAKEYVGKVYTKGFNIFDMMKKDEYIDEFIKVRELLVDMLNPMYEIWNNEFDETNPEYSGDNFNEQIYNDFIARKSEPFLIEANQHSDLIELYFNWDEGGDIECHLKGKPNKVMYMVFVEK